MFESDGYYSSRALQLRLTISVHNLLRTTLSDLHLVESSFIFVSHIVDTCILIAITPSFCTFQPWTPTMAFMGTLLKPALSRILCEISHRRSEALKSIRCQSIPRGVPKVTIWYFPRFKGTESPQDQITHLGCRHTPNHGYSQGDQLDSSYQSLPLGRHSFFFFCVHYRAPRGTGPDEALHVHRISNW